MEKHIQPGDHSALRLNDGEKWQRSKRGVQRRYFIKAIGIMGGSTVLGQPLMAADTSSQMKEFNRAAPKHDSMKPLDIQSVSVSGEIGRRINITILNNLLTLDIEQFLSPFRKKALRGEGYSDYIGLGKNIDAAVRFAAYNKHEKVMNLKQYMVEEIISTQEADGYIGVMVPESRMWKLWDIHEMGYIIMGLCSDYHFFGAKKSLTAARKLADYIIQRWSTMPAGWQKWGQLGIESNMLCLFIETKDESYLNFCVKELALPKWKIDLTIDTIGKTHMYTDIDLCLAQLDLHSVRPDKALLESSRKAVDMLVSRNGMVITGAAGLWESWNVNQEGRSYLGETCATAYQIRLLNRFICMEGNALYGDVMERIVYNALFGAQSPDGRQLRYFMPMEGNRIYFKPDTYCCPNNFRRIMSELPVMIYYKTGKGLAVNLYTASSASVLLEQGVSVKILQQTHYPSQENVNIHIEPSKPAHFPLLLRIPGWCRNAAVSVNGKAWNQPAIAGSFLSVGRLWTAGDTVSIALPMSFRLVMGRRRQSGHVAVMRGPQVFCLDPSQHKTLQDKDAADLTNFIIDPASLKLMNDDKTLYPGAIACSALLGDRLLTIGEPMKVTLTPFPDPGGKVVYFRVPDFGIAESDEILKGG